MRTSHHLKSVAVIFAFPLLLCGFVVQATTVENASYSKMAPLDQYLIGDEKMEISLARSAAPASIANASDVMVLRQNGYETVVKGSNGFVCIVQRSWAKPTDDPEFWNPKVRAPNCFNQAASTTFLHVYLLKTALALTGKSASQILAATELAIRNKELPAIAPGAMCYMMSSQQYLSDSDTRWHPHLMFFVSGDVKETWGANMPGSPLIAGNDPEERVTIFMMMADKWSDGTASSMRN